ncbi:MAG: TVP38/TMEM64 family protein [Patescibacteria group bacterium]
MDRWQKLQKIAFIVFLILIISSLILYEIFGTSFDLEIIRQHLRDFGIWSPLIFVFLYTIGTIFIPSTPFMALAGILFGFKYGLLYTIIGGFLSSIIVFIVSRKLGKERVESILEYKYFKRLGEYNKRLEKGATWDLVVLRMAPIMPFNVLNILMGVSKIKMRDYIVGTLFGLIPSNIITVYVGTFLIKIF